MYRILIFGENSYIGNSFASYLEKFPESFKTEKSSSRREASENIDFTQIDCVLYCAGIAHRKAGKCLHFQINCDLAVSTAKKARQQGVCHFIYLSSSAVFGDISEIITETTAPNPVGSYGKSKLKAETELRKLQTESFDITILRPPMVYGPDCNGNFPKLVKLTRITPFFPAFKNKRSMIYIENLCYFIKSVIERQMSGIFFPQNAEPVCTTELVRLIAENLNKSIHFTRLLNPLICMLIWIPTLKKLFGNFDYNGTTYERVGIVGLEETVRKSVEN